MNEIKNIIDKVDGWLSYNEGELLYNLAKKCSGKGVIVEIGSWKGKSTICLAKGSKAGNNVKIYAIDPHTGSSEHRRRYGKVWTFPQFEQNIRNAKVNDAITPIIKTSEEAARTFNEPVELIFIDGAHEYDLVKLDFELWSPKVIDGGIVAFHDTVVKSEAKKVVKEYVYKANNFKEIGLIDNITFAKKVKKNSVKDRVRNRYVLLLNHVHEFSARLPLPKIIVRAGKKLIRLMQ